jgi:hypothetical protein
VPGITSFLWLKYDLGNNDGSKDFDVTKLEKIAEAEGIKIEWVDSDCRQSGILYWHDPKSFRPTIFLRRRRPDETISNSPVAGFTLAHELGHFYLHPYLKYLSLENIEDDRPEFKRLRGITQFEADQFAAVIFISTRELSDVFESDLIEAMLSGNSAAVQSITKDIYTYCCNKSKRLTKNKNINNKAKTNILLRTQRFINYVREKVVLSCGDLNPSINLSAMKPDDKQSLIEKTKNVFSSYEEVCYRP